MSSEEQPRLQIGHVSFDIVGSPKLLVNQQSKLPRELNGVVTGTNEFREADAQRRLVRLPTGDISDRSSAEPGNPQLPKEFPALKKHRRRSFGPKANFRRSTLMSPNVSAS